MLRWVHQCAVSAVGVLAATASVPLVAGCARVSPGHLNSMAGNGTVAGQHVPRAGVTLHGVRNVHKQQSPRRVRRECVSASTVQGSSLPSPAVSFALGAVASATATCCTNPLDVLKARVYLALAQRCRHCVCVCVGG